MKKYKEVIALVAVIITLIISISAFTERMAVLETQLTTIQRDIAELSVAVNNREEAIRDLRERVAQLEIKVRNLERRADDAEYTRTSAAQKDVAQSGNWTSPAPDCPISGLRHLFVA